jgi:phage gp45-like
MSAFSLTRATLVEVNDSGTQQTLRLRGMAGESFSDVYRLQPHGFSSVPPAGAEGILLRMGETERMLALGFEGKAIRPKGNAAETSSVYGKKIVIEGEEIEIKGNVRITGDILTSNGKDISDQHTHTGVVPGGSLTGVVA